MGPWQACLAVIAQTPPAALTGSCIHAHRGLRASPPAPRPYWCADLLDCSFRRQTIEDAVLDAPCRFFALYRSLAALLWPLAPAAMQACVTRATPRRPRCPSGERMPATPEFVDLSCLAHGAQNCQRCLQQCAPCTRCTDAATALQALSSLQDVSPHR